MLWEPGLVAHAYNPSCSGGRDQGDGGSKLALSQRNPTQKRAGGVAQGVGSDFKPQYHKQTNKQKNIYICFGGLIYLRVA
jgi:hypothetical protein